MIQDYSGLISSAREAMSRGQDASALGDKATGLASQFVDEGDDQHSQEATGYAKTLAQLVADDNARAKGYVQQAVLEYHQILGSRGFNATYRLADHEFQAGECFPDIPAMQNLQAIQRRHTDTSGTGVRAVPGSQEYQDLARMVQSYNLMLRRG